MIESFSLEYFRNLSFDGKLNFSSFNLIVGPNGSGKTSLLEALYFLVVGRSFRATKLDKIIAHQKRSFKLIGVLNSASKKRIGLERSLDTPSINRIDGKNAAAQAQITTLQPVQLLNFDSFRLLLDAASRRKFLDWGLFHQRSDFIELWRRFERVLRQRNQALKERKLSREALEPFNHEFNKLGTEISKLRSEYLKSLSALMNDKFLKDLTSEPLKMVYNAGWPEGEDLAKVLDREFVKDQQLGYTNSGPQRGDWWIELKDHRKVRDVYSRGQQKLLAFTLQLAQGALVYEASKQNCVYLIDDPLAELDDASYKLLERQMAKLPNEASQFFITSLKLNKPTGDLIKLYPKWQVFRLENGQVALTKT